MCDPVKVLVTGGAGFIGSHVVDRLVNEGHDVRVIDNLSTGKLENIVDYFRSDKVDFVNCDIRDTELVRKCVEGGETVIHLAAVTSVPFSIADPHFTHETNVTGTLNLLTSCAEQRFAKFVFISSFPFMANPNTYLLIFLRVTRGGLKR
ncbi:MAG: SDR family NAD(P)-dependent oxidoreductase [Promethearchaeota archaeon]